MDLSFMKDMYIPLVVAACLCIGYCMKHITWLDRISNEYIPTVMLVLGAAFGCLAKGEVTFLVLVSGAVSGLASTGLHQMFKQMIGKGE